MSVRAGVGILLSVVIVTMWLSMTSWTLSCHDIVLYLLDMGVTWMQFPSYWCNVFYMNSVSSGIMCGAFFGVRHAVRIGFINIVSPIPYF